MKKIFAILICLLISNPTFAAPIKSSLDKLSKYFKTGELIKIPSYTPTPFPNSFISIKDGSYKNSPIEVDAFIAYPKKGDGPFPAVVFTHSSGGPKMFWDEWFKFDQLVAKQLLKKGIAVMFLDNYSARGVKNTYIDQSTVPVYAGYIDAFMTLEYLSKDPKINIKKVGITGWSRGGMNSLAIAETRIRDALISKDLYYAASLPRSTECRQSGFFRNPQPIPETKILMVNGEIDEASHAYVCEEYGEKMKANGADIVVKTKRGWGHGFTANYSAEFEAGQEVWHNCPEYYTEDDGMPNKDAKFDDSCITYEGYHIGGTRKTGGKSWKMFEGTFLKFFKKNLLK